MASGSISPLLDPMKVTPNEYFWLNDHIKFYLIDFNCLEFQLKPKLTNKINAK
jgi:hypothetical protein